MLYNRQPWEIPTDLTTEEFAELSGDSVKKVKSNAARAGWAYYTAPEGTVFWDLSTVDRGFPDKIFHGLVKKDNEAKSLKKIVEFETSKYMECFSFAYGDLTEDDIAECQKAALLCRCLEILQDAQKAMPWLALQLASIDLAEITDLDPWDLIDLSLGSTLSVPLFCLDRRYWFNFLVVYVRNTPIYGPLPKIEMTDQELIDRFSMIRKGKISL